MRTKFTFTIFFVALFATLWLSNSSGRATVSGSGSTGAPGEDVVGGVPRTCGGCHAGGTIPVTLGLQVLDAQGTVTTKYSPGSTYTVKAIVGVAGATKPKAYGCQIVCIDSKNADVNGWVLGTTSANSKITSGPVSKRTYLEQNKASVSNEFSGKWTAPAKGTGEITFYAACNGNNQSGSSSGDNAANTKVVLSEGLVGVNDVATKLGQVEVLSNPFQSELVLNIQAAQQTDYSVRIMGLDGRTLQSMTQSLLIGEQTISIPTAGLPTGTYILSVQTKDAIVGKKIVKY